MEQIANEEENIFENLSQVKCNKILAIKHEHWFTTMKYY